MNIWGPIWAPILQLGLITPCYICSAHVGQGERSAWSLQWREQQRSDQQTEKRPQRNSIFIWCTSTDNTAVRCKASCTSCCLAVLPRPWLLAVRHNQTEAIGHKPQDSILQTCHQQRLYSEHISSLQKKHIFSPKWEPIMVLVERPALVEQTLAILFIIKR